MKIRLLPLALILAVFLCGCGSNGVVETRNTGDTREGYIMLPGGRVWYMIAGANKKGIPLVVIHGGPGYSHDYLQPLEGLANERPIVFYDQLGCGDSDKVTNKALWTVESFVDEFKHVRSALNLKRVHILGHSWGTMIAVDYLLQEKSQKGVMGLVLSGPIMSASRFIEDQKSYLNTDLTQAARDVIQKAEKTGDRNAKEYREIKGIYFSFHICRLKELPDCLRITLNKANRGMFEYMWGPSYFELTGTLKDYERVERLGEIKVPALFTCGRFDIARPQTVAYYRNTIPGAEISIFEGASDDHHLEKTAEYIETVRGFLHRAEMMSAR